MAEPKPTITELHSQILSESDCDIAVIHILTFRPANTMRAFLKAVESYIRTNQVTSVKGEDVFKILTYAKDEDRIGTYAHITYFCDGTWKPVMRSDCKVTRYAAFVHLLECTEKILTPVLEHETTEMGLIYSGEGMVNSELLG